MPTFLRRLGSALPVLLSICLLCSPAKAQSQSASKPSGGDKDVLGHFLNPEANDTNTKLEYIEQELFQEEQEVVVQGFVQQYGDRIHLKRTMYASGADLVPGYIFSPKNAPAGKRYPAIVMLHGAFHGALDWHMFRYIDAAVSRGMIVFFPEYRGSRGYGEDQYQNDYGVTDLADVVAGAEYLSQQDNVDANRLGIIGYSRGGMIAMRAIEVQPKRFKAAVEIVGLADFLAYMGYKPDYRRNEVAQEPAFGGKLPADNVEPYLDVSPLSHVDDIQAPLLIVGTTADNEAPFSIQGGRMAEVMKAHGKVFEEKLYDKAPGSHVFIYGDTPEGNDCLKRSIDFLAKYLEP